MHILHLGILHFIWQGRIRLETKTRLIWTKKTSWEYSEEKLWLHKNFRKWKCRGWIPTFSCGNYGFTKKSGKMPDAIKGTNLYIRSYSGSIKSKFGPVQNCEQIISNGEGPGHGECRWQYGRGWGTGTGPLRTGRWRGGTDCCWRAHRAGEAGGVLKGHGEGTIHKITLLLYLIC